MTPVTCHIYSPQIQQRPELPGPVTQFDQDRKYTLPDWVTYCIISRHLRTYMHQGTWHLPVKGAVSYYGGPLNLRYGTTPLFRDPLWDDPTFSRPSPWDDVTFSWPHPQAMKPLLHEFRNSMVNISTIYMVYTRPIFHCIYTCSLDILCHSSLMIKT